MSQCTLYLNLPGLADLRQDLAAALPGYVISGDLKSGALTALKDGGTISFYIRGTGMDADDFYSGMTDMYRYYESIDSDRPEIKSKLLGHIPMFNASLGVVTEDDMDEKLFASLQAMAEKFGGLILLPPANLYNGKGELVFDVEGRSELSDYVIAESPRFFDGQARPGASGLARKQRNDKLMAGLGVPVNAALPPIAGNEDAAIRGKDETIDRLLALAYTCVYAELARDRGAAAARDELAWFADRYGVHALLSPNEKAFVESGEPDGQAVIDNIWRYECLWVAAWALGLLPELSYPGSICDVARLTGLIAEFESREALWKRSKMRGTSEILDEADLIYRYDWACIDAMLKKEPAPAGLDGEVVLERHRMFNWLIRHDNADWDDVRTDT